MLIHEIPRNILKRALATLILFTLPVLQGCSSTNSMSSSASSSATNSRQQNALFSAAQRGSKEGVHSALNDHADINTPDVATGRTALHIAAVNGHKELVAMMISMGANVNPQDAKGDTPLHLAAAMNHEKTVKALLAASPDRSIRNNQGKTAADVAAPAVAGLVQNRSGT